MALAFVVLVALALPSVHALTGPYWSNPSYMDDAGAVQIVPDGYGLTAIGYGSDDHRCTVFIKTAPVDAQGVVNFGAVSGWQGVICAAGGGDDTGAYVNDYRFGEFAVGWSWSASTSGGIPGNDGWPANECFYQEYAPLNDINSRSGWGAAYDGTCNEYGYRGESDLYRVHRAPLGHVIVAVGLSLAQDGDVRSVGLATRRPPACWGPALCNDFNSCTTDTCDNPGTELAVCMNSAVGAVCPLASTIACNQPITSLNGCGSCAGAGTHCTSGLICCGTGCVNPQTDTNNCGTCGNRCNTGQSCQSGTCQGAGPSTCTIGGTTYPDGDANPSNACQKCNPAVSTSIWSNMPDSNACCGGMSTNTQVDANNCGSCGTVCLPGRTCQSGSCVAAGACSATLSLFPSASWSSDNPNGDIICGSTGSTCGSAPCCHNLRLTVTPNNCGGTAVLCESGGGFTNRAISGMMIDGTQTIDYPWVSCGDAYTWWVSQGACTNPPVSGIPQAISRTCSTGCTCTAWTPNPTTVCTGVLYAQTCSTCTGTSCGGNCGGQTRTATGTLSCSCISNGCEATTCIGSTCNNGCTNSAPGTKSCVPTCGNGIVESGEQCDTGNARGSCPNFACSTTCRNNNCPIITCPGPTVGTPNIGCQATTPWPWQFFMQAAPGTCLGGQSCYACQSGYLTLRAPLGNYFCTGACPPPLDGTIQAGCRAANPGNALQATSLQCSLSTPGLCWYCDTGYVWSNAANRCVSSCAGCLIGGLCYTPGSLNPVNACQYCTSGTTWTANSSAACMCAGCFINATCYARGSVNPANACQYCNGTPTWTANVSAACTCNGCFLNGTCYPLSAPLPSNPCQVCLGANTWGSANACTTCNTYAAGRCDAGACMNYDQDGDGHVRTDRAACGGDDCNDRNASIYPGAVDVCNGVDDNCDGVIDDGLRTTYFRDADADGYGDGRTNTTACALPLGYTANSADCNDTDATIHPWISEGGAGLCTDGKENNCPGEAAYAAADYDDFTSGLLPGTGMGDFTCPVGITTAAIPAGILLNQTFFLNCTSTAPSVRSIGIATTAGTTCDATAAIWNGDVLSVPCTTSVYTGTMTCFVNTSRSHEVPPPVSVSFNGDCGVTLTPNCVVQCDQDTDGYNRSVRLGSVEVCSSIRPFDCADTNAAVNPGISETGALCTNDIDDNCNGEADFNGTYNISHGDPGCPISVATIAIADPNCYGSDGHALLNCTYNRPTSQHASISQASTTTGCHFLAWDGNTAQFQCPTTPPFTAGSALITCTVNVSKSYQAPPDQTRTILLMAPGLACDGTLGTCNATGVCAYGAQWLGNVTDSTTGERVGVLSNVTVDGVVFPAPGGMISVPSVPFGIHNLTGTALGYEASTLLDINVTNNPFYYDIPVRPKACKADCTFDGRCDYNCIGHNGCSLDPTWTAAERANITEVCQYVPVNGTRALNTTHTVQCCTGPIRETSYYQTPFTLQSCSPTIVPHRTIVNYNGRIAYLTVLSYAPCP